MGGTAEVTEDANVITESKAVVLPGVGSFEAGMRGLKLKNLVGAIKEFAASNRPMLGICLGAQLMLSRGNEFGVFDGLDIVKGEVVRFPPLENKEKIPQIGWNSVYKSGLPWEGSIFDSVPDYFNAYFVHSYVLVPDSRENIFGTTEYGGYEFCSAFKSGNVYGCQFHPEKSGHVGLEIIKNFLKLV